MSDEEQPITKRILKPNFRDAKSPGAENTGAIPPLEPGNRFGGGKLNRQTDDDIERELQEAMGDANFDQLLNDPGPAQRDPNATPGRLKGRIISIHGQDVFVAVPGGRSQGILPIQQFEEGPPKVGDEVEVTIEGAADGSLILSRKGAVTHVDWSSVAEGLVVEARVTETNKGGLAVEVNGIRGFMPISQIDLYRVEDIEQFVNQKLRCMIAECDPAERNLVVSRRALLEKERAEMAEKVWAELAIGQVREGVIRSVRDFGAFVDLGGVDGLLPISQLSWSRVDKVEDVVKVGQKVKVQVLHLDLEKRKVSLGLKQLAASPWDTVSEKYIPGMVVNGKVTRLADFGAFVELEPAIEGLIHISELAPQRVFRVKDVVQVDLPVAVKILSVDQGARRISLSLKQALAKDVPIDDAAEEEEEYATPPPRPYNPNLRGGIS